jgi:PAS domain S-box-containing protein
VDGSQALAFIAGTFVLLQLDEAGVVTQAEGGGPSPFEIDPRRALGRSAFELLREQPELIGAIRDALAGRSSTASVVVRGRTFATRVDPRFDGAGNPVCGCTLLAIDATGADERLARTEARLAEAQRIAHVGSWEWDSQRNVVTWSDELYRIYGLDKETFGATYESFFERVHPDDRAYTSSVIFEAFRAVKPFVYDHKIVRADGAVRMLHTRGDVVADSSGKPVRLVGCCWDVTDVWTARRELEASLSLLRATLDSTQDGIFAVDLDGRIVDMNARALKLWQIPDSVASTRDTWALVEHVQDYLENSDEFIAREKALLGDHESTATDTIRFKDGRVFERYSTPQRLGGAVIGRVCSFRDATERERLLQSALFLSDASRLFASVEIEPALAAVARAALPLLGTSCAVDMFNESGGPRRVASVALGGAQPACAELPRSVLAGGSSLYTTRQRWCLSVPLVVRGEVVGAFTFTATAGRRYSPADIELVEELARRTALAVENARLSRRWKEALAARDEFLAVASHELRGPLASLHLAVEKLAEGGEAATTRKLAGVIDRADRRLGQFVEELFDATEARAGHLSFELEEVDLGEVVRAVLVRVAPELTRSGSSLATTLRGAVSGTWDRSRLEQVVASLLSNAIKFGLGKPIELRVEGDPTSVQLEVVDHGIGIAPERRAAIFQPFERAVPARHYGGLGLGLYIARTIIEGLGGALELESEVDRGSTFRVKLPKARKS